MSSPIPHKFFVALATHVDVVMLSPIPSRIVVLRCENLLFFHGRLSTGSLNQSDTLTVTSSFGEFVRSSVSAASTGVAGLIEALS